MIFRQMFDAESSTYTYLLADEASREAALIDSVQEQADRDAKLIQELGLSLKYLLETHVHADHITGVTRLKAQFPRAQSVVSARGGAPCADHLAQDGDVFRIGELEIQVLATPGHTNGCISYHVDDRVFTGDALLIRGCGRTDFQEGSASQLYDSVNNKLFALPDQTIIYPGHNYIGLTASTIGEEKQHNPRLGGGKSKAAFVEIMDNLKLAQPAKIMEAVPANLKCGNLAAVKKEVKMSIQELYLNEIYALYTDKKDQYEWIDVRRPDEWATGTIPGAKRIVLDNLPDHIPNLDPNRSHILICRSGARSGRACELLSAAGIKDVTNFGGGMLSWYEAGYALEK